MVIHVETSCIEDVSFSIYEDGSVVVFLPASGDVVTCSSDKLDMWLETGEGELADMLHHLGWRSDRAQLR